MLNPSQKQRVNCIVLSATNISPHMRRLVLGGPELSAWLAHPDVQAPAAWVKVFPEGIKGRAYTIRAIDMDRSNITIDFVMHGHEQGHHSMSVSTWAKHCQAGDTLHIAGPRLGGFHLAADTDWLWIGADLTALPAAIRIIESLPAHIQVVSFFAVDALDDQQIMNASCHLRARWRTINIRPETLSEQNILIKDIHTLKGKGQVWIAGEARWVKSWQNYWIEQQLPPHKLSSKGYWKLGELDYRD